MLDDSQRLKHTNQTLSPLSSTLEFRTVQKCFGNVEVIHGVDLTITEGEFIVFVGPSGCGKSTLLRMISGLEDVSSGDILLDGRRVNDVPPARRGTAMVFQSYALYPHLTVRENIAFGLSVRKTPKVEIERRVSEAVSTLKLDELLERYPRELSGGQRQRVAIGRAIVAQPRVFLFDEPLSNLDAELRVHMRAEIAELHKRLGNTMVYVTHDQIEAMTLADRIVVLRGGQIEQVGSPQELYLHPRNIFVAQFIGSPKMNIFSLGDLPKDVGLTVPNGAVQIGLRPEDLKIVEPEHGMLSGRVGANEYTGASSMSQIILNQSETSLLTIVDGQSSLERGAGVSLYFNPERAHYFDADGVAIYS